MRHPSDAHAAGELLEALGSSLDLRVVMAEAFPLLSRLVPADRAAFCVSRPRAPGAYTWIVADLPDAFFGGYAELAPHDFVRRSVLKTPGKVVRDAEMVERRELERNLMYRRSRELGAPMEHVMAVLLVIAGEDAHGGVTLYRDRRVPFSDRDQALLQKLVRPFAQTIRNCQSLEGLTSTRDALRWLLDRHGLATLVLDRDGRELARTPRATELIERWFAPADRAGGIPGLVGREIARRQRRGPATEGPVQLRVRGANGDLRLSLERLPDAMGEARWTVEISEVACEPSVPGSWRGLLSPRQCEVAARALAGWDRRRIARDLGCGEETVKSHLNNIWLKLGVRGREGLTLKAKRDLEQR